MMQTHCLPGIAGLCAAAAVLIAGPALPAAEGAEAMPAIVNAAPFLDHKASDCGLQKAIDAVPPGGILLVPAGKYTLKRSLVLKSDMTFSGVGPETIFTILPEPPCTELAADAPLPQPAPEPIGDAILAAPDAVSTVTAVRVKSAAGFEPGMQITVRDKDNNAWNEAFAVITGIDGDTLTLDRPLMDQYRKKKMKYRAGQGGQTGNLFPLIFANKQKNIVVQFLAILGPEKQPPFNRFVLDAIHLVDCENIMVTRCVVERWHSDGFSIQGGKDALVMDNIARKCAGHGFHPGTGLQNSFWSGNLGEENGAFGLYYCWNNRHVVVSHNRFIRNGTYGIGRLGDGGDTDNLVYDNVCEFNGGAGIHAGMWGDCKLNFVVGNTVRNNSQKTPGAGILLQKARQNVIAQNKIIDDQAAPTQVTGIEELKDGTDGNWFAANEIKGAGQPVVKNTANTTVAGTFPGGIPPERLAVLDELLKKDAANWSAWQARAKKLAPPKLK